MYLAAVMDWHSRYVLSWELSNTMESWFCVAALERALERGEPEVFNTDQGAQFTSEAFTSVLLDREIAIRIFGLGPSQTVNLTATTLSGIEQVTGADGIMIHSKKNSPDEIFELVSNKELFIV